MLKSPESKDNGEHRVIVGQIIKLSEVLELIQGKKIDSLYIYAGKAIIFDDNSLEAHGKNVSIIAPEWYMFGVNKITVDGLKGENHNPLKAAEGKSYGEKGADGLPGKPGRSAGNFLGIGDKFYNSSALTISANGGEGGQGQNGGNGKIGKSGRSTDPQYDEKGRTPGKKREKKESKFAVFISTIYTPYSTFGEKGEQGGDAGKGGKGGLGGNSGHIELFKDNDQNVIKCTTKSGKEGINGDHGNFGKGGPSGEDQVATHVSVSTIRDKGKTSTKEYWQDHTSKPHEPPNGEDGRIPDGLNSSNRQNPETTIDMIWYKPLIEYKKFMAKNLGNKFLHHNTEGFFKILNEIQGNLGNASEID